MKYRRLGIILGGLVYLLLWAIALNGGSRLVAPLTVPIVLVVLVGGGNWLNNFMGIERKPQKFRKRNDEQ
ncbi:MAG: hypothetical protein WCL31_03825 [Actinomycetes bacterium]